MDDTETRVEHDSLGQWLIPHEVYWGIHTARAIDNFPITRRYIGEEPKFVRAIAEVKRAAAEVNIELGLIKKEVGQAIVEACVRVESNQYDSHFIIDPIQGGAGTSTNMNANEIIANLALEILGYDKGRYDIIHPVDDVNRSQSTNDVYPTSIKITCIRMIDEFCLSVKELCDSIEAKAEELADVLIIARTQLQDAVPITLKQVFSAQSAMLKRLLSGFEFCKRTLSEIHLGGTAIGTGINTEPRYAEMSCKRLSDITGLDLFQASNYVAATQDTAVFVGFSNTLKQFAITLSKICSDLRLMSSGPQAGFGDIQLPPRAAGSSVMPGKVNPVIPEVVNQICFQVIGNDLTISLAAEGGQLQLNAFEPIMAKCLFESCHYLTTGCQTLDRSCVRGITADREKLADRVSRSVSLATALSPIIGYEEASNLAKYALATSRTIKSLALENNDISEKEIDDALSSYSLTHPSHQYPRSKKKSSPPNQKK
ncbi:aspartate ammonia-lyase [Candidatus Ichthyocystis hellenicum]|uniref:aspartate ammonia-lyase n=1 Tax=Candidatus Ichthyocystis hellenicum TaxID=1561003 RepID=UPI000B894331|nr:aspartate ammonia-lyase [Candidatus Ichthyocystis hellenicum]